MKNLLFLLIATSLTAATLAAQDKPQRAIIYRFAVVGHAGPSSGLAAEACPKTALAADVKLQADDQLLDKIGERLIEKLSKKMPTTTAAAEQPQVGSLLVTGCIIRADPGNAAKRMAGMGLGASHLDGHVRLLLQTTDGVKEVRGFDVAVTGASKLPPLGPIGVAGHAAQGTRQTLSADAAKFADQVLKQLKAGLRR